jgi:hypothetical protein
MWNDTNIIWYGNRVGHQYTLIRCDSFVVQRDGTNKLPPTRCHQQVTTNGIPPTICCLLAAAASCLVRVKRVTFLSGEGLIFIHYGSVGLTFSNCMLITSYFVFLVTLKEWTLKLFGTAKPPLKGMHVHSIFWWSLAVWYNKAIHIISGRKWSLWESLKNSITYHVASSKPDHRANWTRKTSDYIVVNKYTSVV